MIPGRNAIRNRNRFVAGATAEPTTQLSSQDRPVGSSMPQ